MSDGFILMRPIHFPDGTEAKELPLYPDIEELLVDFLRKKIDEERQKSERKD